VEEEVPGNGGWAKDGEAEEPARVAGESAAGRKGTRRSEHKHQAHGDAAPAGEYMEV